MKPETDLQLQAPSSSDLACATGIALIVAAVLLVTAILPAEYDVIGHDYGPYSHEVQDVTLRTDIVLADLFRYLDERLGRDNYIVAFTADHGVSPPRNKPRQ